MNIRLLSAEALTPAQWAAWAEIQRTEPALDSPYFRPEFTQAVAAVRGPVDVGVLENDGQPVGFFPFHRGKGNVGRPVGGVMSDFHGVIARSGTTCDPRQLLRGCNLLAWHFNHLPVSQSRFREHCWSSAPSPYIDLSRGWEGYQGEQHTIHPRTFKKAMGKLRRAESEAGPLRVELHTTSDSVFQSLVRWKADQYHRTGVTDVLAFGWTLWLLDRIRKTSGDGFSGMLSSLYMGDVLVAVLLSMRSYGVLHAWFSAYRRDFAVLSPGLVLWLELARLCPALGIQRIDLGKGPELYKQHLMSGAIDVAEGSVDLRPIRGMLRQRWHQAYDWLRHSPVRGPLRSPGRIVRSMVEARTMAQ
ncbi:MAG: GNAT family N-acetyltransferase [Planctomycetaceae bacterium]|nr:GNAT family N-acetyltransferase [Planctomycetaceae bacterium]